MKVGIIGYGSMGKMLLWKFFRSGITGPGDLYAANRTQEKLEEARDAAVICSNSELARMSDIIFVCVRPSDMRTVLSDIGPHLKKDALLVTLNGSIPFALIKEVVNCRTAKVIPSVTAEIERSQTIVCYNDLVSNDDRQKLESLLSCIGEVIELPEKEAGMGSELVSCMPGFIASVFDVICSSAEEHTELPREQIIRMVLNTMSATGDLMLQKGLSFDEVVSRVATKGGITEEGTKVIYDKFPDTARELFDKTLAKREMTAQKAAELFGETQETAET